MLACSNFLLVSTAGEEMNNSVKSFHYIPIHYGSIVEYNTSAFIMIYKELNYTLTVFISGLPITYNLAPEMFILATIVEIPFKHHILTFKYSYMYKYKCKAELIHYRAQSKPFSTNLG